MFKNLKGAHVTESNTEIYIFSDLPGAPWLKVHPGGELNKPYYQEMVEKSTQGRKARRQLLQGKVDSKALERNRNIDRKLYPRYIAAGEWGGWLDDETGAEVPYSVAAVTELFEQLPSYLFDGLRAYCNEPENFLEDEMPDEEDVEETVGN